MKLFTDKLKSIFFKVEKVPSVEVMKNPDMEFNSENSFAIVATLSDKREKILNFCSSVYKLIENALVLEPLIPVLEEKFKKIHVSVGNDKDAQFSVRISPLVPSFSPNTEVIKPAVTFTNSYDGKVLAQATGGLVRYLVNSKGEVFETYSTFLKGLSFSYTFKHSNENIYSMAGISAQIDRYIADFKTVEAQIELLKAINITNATTAKLERLVRKLSKGTVFPLKQVEETIERINYESEVFGTDANLWSVYNSMNYILENTDASLSNKMRMDADAKIYANVCEFLPAPVVVEEV